MKRFVVRRLTLTKDVPTADASSGADGIWLTRDLMEYCYQHGLTMLGMPWSYTEPSHANKCQRSVTAFCDVVRIGRWAQPELEPRVSWASLTEDRPARWLLTYDGLALRLTEPIRLIRDVRDRDGTVIHL